MVRLKGCTKCGGDLYLQQDVHGSYVSCFQCGKIMADLDREITVSSIDEALDMATALERSA